MQKKFYIKTFGCQMNEYDSNKICDLMNTISFKKSDHIDDADCFIFNTCHIREKATQKVYSDIGKMKKVIMLILLWVHRLIINYQVLLVTF